MAQSLAGFLGDSLSTRIALAVGFLLAVIVLAGLRNIYFHPLSKFPGPKLWAATPIPFSISLAKGRLPQRATELHNKYGDVVRLSPNQLSVAGEGWSAVYGHRAGCRENQRDPVFFRGPDGYSSSIIDSPDIATHARYRRCINNSFTTQALKAQVPVVEAYASKLVDGLRKRVLDSQDKSAVFNIGDWFGFTIADIIGDLALGEHFGCLDKGDFHPWVAVFNQYIQGWAYMTIPRFFPGFEYIVGKLMPKRLKEAMQEHHDYSANAVYRRLEEEDGTERADFVTPFLKYNKEEISRQEIATNFTVIFVAGFESTATTMTGALCCLSRPEYRETMAKLTSEIRSAFAREEDITVESVKALPYLGAVIDEGLRLFQPTPLGFQRVVMPDGGVVLDDGTKPVPAGTSIVSYYYVVTRQEHLFHRAKDFVPERWFPADSRPTEFRDDRLEAFNPFGAGQYACVGKPLAWAEMRLILARLIWAFDFHEEPGKRLVWEDQRMWTTIERQPALVRTSIREGSGVKG